MSSIEGGNKKEHLGKEPRIYKRKTNKKAK